MFGEYKKLFFYLYFFLLSWKHWCHSFWQTVRMYVQTSPWQTQVIFPLAFLLWQPQLISAQSKSKSCWGLWITPPPYMFNPFRLSHRTSFQSRRPFLSLLSGLDCLQTWMTSDPNFQQGLLLFCPHIVCQLIWFLVHWMCRTINFLYYRSHKEPLYSLVLPLMDMQQTTSVSQARTSNRMPGTSWLV